jgi:hypothetical protein
VIAASPREGDVFLVRVDAGRRAVGQVVGTYKRQALFMAVYGRLLHSSEDEIHMSLESPLDFLALSSMRRSPWAIGRSSVDIPSLTTSSSRRSKKRSTHRRTSTSLMHRARSDVLQRRMSRCAYAIERSSRRPYWSTP